MASIGYSSYNDVSYIKIEKKKGYKFYKGNNNNKTSMSCDYIFYDCYIILKNTYSF